MALSSDKKTLQEIFETLQIVRKGTEDDFELRSSSDGKVWGVKVWDEPSRPTYVLYAGADAKELASDAADYDLEEEDDEEDGEEEGDEEGEKDDE